MIDPGLMNRRITVETAGTPVPDGGGGWTPGTPTTVEVWAYIEGLAGNEGIQAMQTGMQRPHRFTTNYRTDITGATVLIYAGRRFDVKSVVDTDTAHEELVILADEIVP